MKKQAMSLAVTAALLGGAVSVTAQQEQSMYINEGGLGEVLIYPFYSANGGNDTQIHIVNTTNQTKAVKVRFIESQNSQEVLDFNLYLSPYDEWAAVITPNPLLCEDCDGAIVRTTDNSCTVPRLGTGSRGTTTIRDDGKIQRDQAFVNFEYDNVGDTDESFSRTTEGYVEMIEMGQLNPLVGLGAAAVHGANGVPADCDQLVAAWNVNPQGVWRQAPIGQAELLAWDGGGLYGYGVLINVDNGTSVGLDATAIDNFANTENGPPLLHTFPSDIAPGLFNGTDLATVFNAGEADTYLMDNGRDAVSALFMTQSIINDYVIDPGLNAQTDWVITFPTKREYVQNGADVPFTNEWNGTNACEAISLTSWDREEASDTAQGSGFSPAPPGVTGLQLCKEVNVLTFGTGSAVEASDNIRVGANGTLDYSEGWALVDFLGATQTPGDPRTLTSEDGFTFLGLPALGVAVFEYTNGTLDGGTALANYEAAIPHKTNTTIIED